MTGFQGIADRRQGRLVAVTLFCSALAAASGPARGQVFTGDGSSTDNPDLLRTSSVCSAPCDKPQTDQPINLYAPPPVIDQGDRLVPGADAENAPLSALVPGQAGTPYEADAPWFETDWSVRLRGSYIESTEGVEALVRVEPEFSLIHASRSGEFTLETSAELNLDRDDTPRVSALDLSAEQVFALDRLSNLSLSGDISLSQGSINDPGVPDEVTGMPIELEGSAALGADRQFGQLGLEASVDLTRKLMTSTQTDGGPQSNLDQQYWAYGGALRAGYQLTPILRPFVQTDAHFIRFDAPPASDPASLNGWDTNYLVGLEASWQDVLTAEVTAGLGTRQFQAGGQETLRSAVYGFNLDYVPDEALAIGAEFSTTLNPGNPDEGQPRSVTYAASADVNYALNSWLTLRGSVGGDFTDPRPGTVHVLNYGAGVGADVALTDNSSLTFDYAYDESRTTAEPVERAHEFALGLMFSR